MNKGVNIKIINFTLRKENLYLDWECSRLYFTRAYRNIHRKFNKGYAVLRIYDDLEVIYIVKCISWWPQNCAWLFVRTWIKVRTNITLTLQQFELVSLSVTQESHWPQNPWQYAGTFTVCRLLSSSTFPNPI